MFEQTIIKQFLISLFIMCLTQCIIIYKLKQENNTLSMLISFDEEIINNREKLLDDNGIKFDDYIFIEKDKE